MNDASPAVAGAGAGMVMIINLVIVLLLYALMWWKVFGKAGQPGWASIVPIYNLIVLLQIAGKPLWWIILFLVPIANIVIIILVSLAVAEKFGKGTGFGVGLLLLPIIFYPILGFGSAEYQGDAAPAVPGA